MDRAEEIACLKRCGSADWALVLRALLTCGSGPVDSGYLLDKLELAKTRSYNILSADRREEYFRLKHSALAAKITVVEDCT